MVGTTPPPEAPASLVRLRTKTSSDSLDSGYKTPPKKVSKFDSPTDTTASKLLGSMVALWIINPLTLDDFKPFPQPKGLQIIYRAQCNLAFLGFWWPDCWLPVVFLISWGWEWNTCGGSLPFYPCGGTRVTRVCPNWLSHHFSKWQAAPVARASTDGRSVEVP